ncbi:MAG TPA: polymer-forming cytoskeletal protein [Gemmatimonadaceae bacterium]|jgi:hypothetical protein|nr:polymer-forming cytoskeletal protein [Gemmatimonadaceae bacterium]
MRAIPLSLALAALAAAAAPARAQGSTDSTSRAKAPALTTQLRREIGRLAGVLGFAVPPADSFALGGRTVPANTTVTGPLAAANGAVDVSGRVNGNVVALNGDVIVHQGGRISGDAVSVGGRVRLEGGTVLGEMRSLSGLPGSTDATAARAPAATTWGSMKVVLGWFVVLLLIGVGVMTFAERNLDGVVAVLERHLARAFWMGLLAEVALVPVLILGVVLLCITVIGILLVPFAIVAYVVAAAGLVALGFLAVARFTGRGLFRVDPGAPVRAVNLRALLTGLALYLGVWFIVAALTWVPAAQPVLRAIALAVTWVALTAGLGATLLSRAGTQYERPRDSSMNGTGAEPPSWQTPTPVAGVAAARRPVATTTEGR